jgi:hypothetical protein
MADNLFERLATAMPPTAEKTQENLFERLTTMAPPAAEKTQELVPNKKPEPAQRMLDWMIQRWPKDTICIGDVRQYGPGSLRNPKSIIDAAEVLSPKGLARTGQITSLRHAEMAHHSKTARSRPQSGLM